MKKKQQNKIIGDLGERIVCNFLERKGFSILERNYTTSYAEIDVIAQKRDIVHFIEVKTVSHETKQDLRHAVARATWRPEEQVHAHKKIKISLGVESWLQKEQYGGVWQIDVAAVRVVPRETYATVKMIENVVFD